MPEIDNDSTDTLENPNMGKLKIPKSKNRKPTVRQFETGKTESPTDPNIDNTINLPRKTGFG